MPVTSAGTYARAFGAESNLYHAAGNYENTWAAKLAKGLVGLLTLGIGYEIIRLIEHYHNVVPKVEEYCANAETIYHRVASAVVTGQQSVKATLADKRHLRLEQHFDEHGTEPFVLISDGKHVERIEGTFKEILIKLSQDFEDAPGMYDVSDNYRPQAFFLEMGSCEMAAVINYSPSTKQSANLFASNLDNIHTTLTQACINDESSVKVSLCEGVEVEFPSYFNHETGQNMVKVMNGDRMVALESTFETLCQEMIFLLYLRDAADRDTETFEGWVNKNKNSQGAIPTTTQYSFEASRMTEAVKNRLEKARRRFDEAYGEDTPSERTPLLFKE